MRPRAPRIGLTANARPPMATPSPSTATPSPSRPAPRPWRVPLRAGSGLDAVRPALRPTATATRSVYIGASSTTAAGTVGDVLRRDRPRQRRATATISLRRPARGNDQRVGADRFHGHRFGPASLLDDLDRRRSRASPARPTSSRRSDLDRQRLGAGNTTRRRAPRTTALPRSATLIQDGSTLNVNGKTITFRNAADSAALRTLPAGSGVAATSSPTATATRRSILQARDAGRRARRRSISRPASRPRANASGAATLATTVRPDQLLDQLRAARCRSPPARRRPRRSSAPATRSQRSASAATPARRPRFTAGRTAAAGSLSGKTLTFSSFNGGTRGQRHLRRRLRRHGQDARPAQCGAAGQQPERDDRLDRQADDHHHQRVCFVDPRFGRRAARSAAR